MAVAETPTGVGPTPASRAAGPTLPPIAFDARRWSQTDRIVGAATLVLFISLFLPWFGVSFGIGSVTVDGLWHGYMYITLIVCLAILVYLFARAAWAELPARFPLPHEGVLAALTGINFLLTLIAFLLKPGGSAVGWEFGAVIGLLAAIVALVPKAIPMAQAKWGTKTAGR